MLVLVGVLLLIFVIYRLILNRRRVNSDTWEKSVGKAGLLDEFEKWVSKRVGARPRSMPMATWLRRSIPVDCDELVLLYERAVFGLNAESRRSLDDSIQIVKLRWKEQEKTPGTKDARGVVKF
jgi:hypothetical protein